MAKRQVVVSTISQEARKRMIAANESRLQTINDAKLKGTIEWLNLIEEIAKDENKSAATIVESSGLSRQTYHDRKNWVDERKET